MAGCCARVTNARPRVARTSLTLAKGTGEYQGTLPCVSRAALTPEEAEAYQAGAISQTEWILIGIGVLIILAVA